MKKDKGLLCQGVCQRYKTNWDKGLEVTASISTLYRLDELRGKL